MMKLPPLAPVPPPTIRNIISSEEWEACLEAWIVLVELRLRLPTPEFDSQAGDDSLVAFLSSYVQQLATSTANNNIGLLEGLKAQTLRRSCFLLTRRLLLSLEGQPSPWACLEWPFLGDLCVCYHKSSTLKSLVSRVWEKHQGTIASSIEKAKSMIIKQLSLPGSTNYSGLAFDIRRLTVLASFQPAIGHILMTGSDYLDTLFEVYKAQRSEVLRQALVANTYVGFTSLLKGQKPNVSLLLDHLFSLKAAAGLDSTGRGPKVPTLLSDFVCSSDVLTRLERSLIGFPQKRGVDLIANLRIYQIAMKPHHRRYQHVRKKDKGKGRANDANVDEESRAHRMSLITQIQELFPDLGSSYVFQLLEFYTDNAETVIAHLLENSLPPELQPLDKFERLPDVSPGIIGNNVLVQHAVSPLDEPALARKNAFDDDDIVELARSGNAENRLHFGRAGLDDTADAILADRSQHAINKAAIFSALAAFDSDDDERDDTYDIADVGGTVDAAPPAGTEADAAEDVIRRRRAEEEADKAEMMLFSLYKTNPGLFARDSATRRSQPRESVKRETGMTDEAIEGWAIMLVRDPKRESRLERKMALSGNGFKVAFSQKELPSTAYREPSSKSAEAEPGMEDSEEAGGIAPSSVTGGHEQSRRCGRGGSPSGSRGRGRGGRGGGSGGGHVAGSSGDRETAITRQKKDANKASRANHNRRDQRARKMAQAGGIPL